MKLKLIYLFIKNFFNFILLFIGFYLFFLILLFIFDISHLYEKKDISSYSDLINKISKKYHFSTLNKNAKIIIVIDSFDINKSTYWHGQLILDTLLSNIRKEYSSNILFKDYVVIPFNINSSFNTITALNDKLQKKINLFLFINELKYKYPHKIIGINESYIHGHILSNIYLSTKLVNKSTILSVAAGNYKSISLNDNSFFDILDNYFMKLMGFTKQLIFFSFFKSYLNPDNFKFNLNYLSDKAKYSDDTILNISDIYNFSDNHLRNNLLFFPKRFPNYFLISKSLSSSSATAIGLNYLLFK